MTRPKYLGSRYIDREFDGRACPYCAEIMKVDSPTRRPTKEHPKPKSLGGTSEDCIIVCSKCNHDKDSKTLPEFLEWLKRQDDPRVSAVQVLVDRTSPRRQPKAR
jgi:5-methylcytosine-specific restriction endonuclease McrA